MKQGYVLSDLHYFSCRSQFPRHRSEVFEKIHLADIIVLNGDIFDFRWCKLTLDEAIFEATALLQEMMQINSQCQFIL